MSPRPRRRTSPVHPIRALCIALVVGGTPGIARTNAVEGPQPSATPVFTSELGGAGSDEGDVVALDPSGNVYVAGWTKSGDFPVTAEALDTARGDRDAFVAKLAPDGRSVEWATYLGGSSEERALALLVEPDGSVVVGGWTTSDDFPATDMANRRHRAGAQDGFVARLDPSGGRLLFATYVGGRSDDAVTALATGPAGEVTAAGWTDSSDFPTISNGYQPRSAGAREAFALGLDPTGRSLRWSTFLGGSGDDEAAGVAWDGEGYLVVAGTTDSRDFPTTSGAFDRTRRGRDAFVARLAGGRMRLAAATLYGGRDDEDVTGFALAPDGGAVLVGTTRSEDLPVAGPDGAVAVAGGRDAFVAHLSTSCGALLYARPLGGSRDEVGGGVAVDPGGSTWVVGRTTSSDLPVTSGAPDASRSGPADGFLAALDDAGRLRFLTYVGGDGEEELRGVSWYAGAGLAAVGTARRVPLRERGPLAGHGAAPDALVTRFRERTKPVPAAVSVLGGEEGTAGLVATRPVLGEELVVTVHDAAPNATVLLFQGPRAPEPVHVDGLGLVRIEPSRAVALAALRTDAAGSAAWRLGLPASTGLSGLPVVLQALSEGRPGGAVELVLGE